MGLTTPRFVARGACPRREPPFWNGARGPVPRELAAKNAPWNGARGPVPREPICLKQDFQDFQDFQDYVPHGGKTLFRQFAWRGTGPRPTVKDAVDWGTAAFRRRALKARRLGEGCGRPGHGDRQVSLPYNIKDGSRIYGLGGRI